MKINYIYPYGSYSKAKEISRSAIASKINWQISALKKQGVDITLVELPIVISSPVSFLKSVSNAKKLLKSSYNDVGIDGIIYYRTLYPYLINYSCIKKKHSCKVVYELQSIEKNGFKSSLSTKASIVTITRDIYLSIVNKLFGRKIKQLATGLVSVTNEINEYNKELTENKLKYLTNGNGITLDSIPLRTFTSANPKIINVLSVSSVYPWHGLDRFILGLASYSGSRDICLHIVGNGPDIPHLKELTEKYNLTSKVLFHGFKSGAELDAMFDMCQIGLDALAGHRKNLYELSTLKSKEYCARGIPFIMASKDTDFPAEWSYVTHVSADDSPIDMDTVISFTERVMADENHAQTMRKYAEEHLSWDAKMKTLKEFLESL